MAKRGNEARQKFGAKQRMTRSANHSERPRRLCRGSFLLYGREEGQLSAFIAGLKCLFLVAACFNVASDAASQ